jgi:hypothetical protein
VGGRIDSSVLDGAGRADANRGGCASGPRAGHRAAGGADPYPQRQGRGVHLRSLAARVARVGNGAAARRRRESVGERFHRIVS